MTHGPAKDFVKVPSLDYTVGDLQDNRKKIFVVFHVREYKKDPQVSVEDGSASTVQVEDSIPGVEKCAFDILLSSRREFRVPDKKKRSKAGYYANITKSSSSVKIKITKVQWCDINDYKKFIDLFSNFLWNIDPHNKKLKSRSIYISEVIEKSFFNFNDPKKHKYKITVCILTRSQGYKPFY